MENLKKELIDKLLEDHLNSGLLQFVPTENQEAYGLALYKAELTNPYSLASRIEAGEGLPVTETILLDDNTKTFVANGKKFRVTTGLNTGRYEVLERYQIEFGYGVSFKEMFDAWVEQYKMLQGDNRRADAAVNAYKVINGITNIDNSLVYAFQLCTLFINYEDEDITSYDLDLAAQKIEDWRLGAIDARFFFRQAATSVAEYTNVYKLLAQNISEALKK